jgi:chaperonin GroEL (HSP60 family)
MASHTLRHQSVIRYFLVHFNLSFLDAGTTCATVLTQAILTEGCKSIAAGVNVMDLRCGINMAVDAVISDLKSKASMLSTPEEIKQVMDFLEKVIC